MTETYKRLGHSDELSTAIPNSIDDSHRYTVEQKGPATRVYYMVLHIESSKPGKTNLCYWKSSQRLPLGKGGVYGLQEHEGSF